MASPQKEHGFTAVANEIYTAVIGRDFTGQQCRCLMLLWRQSYGWQKTSAEFSLNMVSRHLGITKTRASKLLQRLTEMGVIVRETSYSRTSPSVYRFEKDHERWKVGGGVPPQGDSLQGDWESYSRTPGESYSRTPIKERSKEKQHGGVPPQGDSLQGDSPLEPIPDLGSRVVRQLVQLQPSGLTQADRTAVAELLRNTDKSPRRVLEAVADAVRETQAHRRSSQTRAPVRFALAVVGRLLSEPEPCPPEFVTAPEGWRPP